MAIKLLEKQLKADINFATAGDHIIVAAPTSPVYVAIDQINFIVNGATNIQFKSGATSYGGAYPMATNQGLVLENVYSETDGVITIDAGSAFTINSSAPVQVSGFIRYRLVNL